MKNILIGIAVVGILYILVQAIGLMLILALMKKQEEKPPFIQNSDTMRRKFCYRVEKPVEEILAVLAVPGHFEDYRYTFDSHEMVITFSRELIHPDARYWVYLYPDESGCNLRVATIDGWGTGNSCPQIQNPFWQQLLDARPIPYYEVNKQ